MDGRSALRAHTDDLLEDGKLDNDELSGLSREELKDMVEMLYAEGEDKDKQIAVLSKGKRRGKVGVDEAELDSLREQVTQTSDRLQAVETERDLCRDEFAEHKVMFDRLLDEKKEVELQLRTTRKALEDAENELQKITQANRESMRKNVEVNKHKKEALSEHGDLLEGKLAFFFFLFLRLCFDAVM